MKLRSCVVLFKAIHPTVYIHRSPSDFTSTAYIEEGDALERERRRVTSFHLSRRRK